MSEVQPDYIISDLWPLVVGIDEVQIDPSNAMTHDEANLDQIAGSLNKHKQRKPVVINRATGTIEAGNGTLLAARRLGWQYIAVVGEEDDAQTAVSYGIADNAVASQAWDWERLKKHLDTFDAPGEVPGVDDGLLATLKEALAAEALQGRAGDAEPQVDRAAELQIEYGTEVGQLWRLGEHRLAVGDCTDKGVVEGVMGGEKAGLFLTDPPYGVAKAGWDQEFPNGNIWIHHRSYLIDGANVLIFPGEAKLPYKIDILFSVFDYQWPIVWYKPNAMQFGKTGYTVQSIVWWLSIGIPKKRPKFRDVIVSAIVPQNNDFGHPSPKNLDVISELVKQFSDETDLLYEPYLGSGTTLIACENLGRRCRGIEIDPGYAAVTLRRWEELTGGKAERIIDNG